MKNNKGFTLIELLAVIILLSVVVTIAVPSISGISKKVKESMLDTKLDLILESAKLYGGDNISIISESTKIHVPDEEEPTKSYPCENVTIKELVEKGYLTYDKKDIEAGFVMNPKDNSNLNDQVIVVYLKNKRAVTVLADEKIDGTIDNSCS